MPKKKKEEVEIAETVAQSPPPQVVYVEKESTPPPKQKSSIGFFGCLVIFGMMGMILIVLTAVFARSAGFLDDVVCEVVRHDSDLGIEFNCFESSDDPVDNNSDTEPSEGDSAVLVTDLETVVTRVVEENANSIVGIGINGGVLSQDRIVGSGFVVSTEGLIVTNQHVVSRGNADDYFVSLTGTEEIIPVEQIYRDELNDIAILKVTKKGLAPVKVGDSEALKVGQTVIAIGNPLGSLTSTVTVGTLSAQGRDVEVGDGGFNFNVRSYTEVLQTDAAINPGNSGGPLFNSSGEVIGVNFATVQGADNLSFALPINRIQERIDEVGEFGSFRIPFLGVEYQRRLVFFNDEGIVGAIVTRAIPGTPAVTAGFLENDVIVQYDGKSLEGTTLAELIQSTEIGKEVKVVVIREEKTQTLTVTIGDRTSFE